MAVIRYLTSPQVLQVFLSDAFILIDRVDLSNAILAEDNAWDRGLFYFAVYPVDDVTLGTDLLISGEEAEEVAASLIANHKLNGSKDATEPKWVLSDNVTYWEPKSPVQSYPGYEIELYLRVTAEVAMEDFNTINFVVDTNMQTSFAIFDFGDGIISPSYSPNVSHVYELPGTYTVKVSLENDQSTVIAVVTGVDPMMPPSMSEILATELEITATEPS